MKLLDCNPVGSVNGGKAASYRLSLNMNLERKTSSRTVRKQESSSNFMLFLRHACQRSWIGG